MATKGLTTIELEMYAALEELMAQTIGGTFYTSGTRPLEADTEDAVLTVANATADQIQDGRARLNIYVPDIDTGGESPMPDKARIVELEAVADKVVEKLNEADTAYCFDLFQATEAIAVPGKCEHIVSIGLHFRLATFS